jgi:hypothetical protein
MKKGKLFLFLLLCLFQRMNAQVAVSATLGNPSGTHTSLKIAFDAINTGTYQGAITVNITSNIVETASAVLYGSGYLSLSSYSTITIKTVGGAYSITGNMPNGQALIVRS